MLPESLLLGSNTQISRNLNVTTTGAVIKAAPGQIFNWTCSNSSATIPVFLKFYNQATAPTGANTPVETVMVPALFTLVRDLTDPDAYSLGISVRASTVASDADATAPVANSCILTLKFK